MWPDGFPETMQTEHWQCRYLVGGTATTTHAALADLLRRAAEAGLDFIKTENLFTFAGERGYSLRRCDVSTKASTRLTCMKVSPRVRGHWSLISTMTCRAHCAAVSETSMLGPRLMYP